MLARPEAKGLLPLGGKWQRPDHLECSQRRWGIHGLLSARATGNCCALGDFARSVEPANPQPVKGNRRRGRMIVRRVAISATFLLFFLSTPTKFARSENDRAN